MIYLAINVLFASLYSAVPGCIENVAPGSFVDDLFFSIETLATVGYGRMVPVTLYGHVVSSFEIFLGMVFTAVLTGVVFVRFSRPRSRIVYATHPVVTRYAGLPALMLRLGNARPTVLTQVNVQLTTLLRETAIEGQVFRRSVDLPLVRSSFPIFPMTLTLIHQIDGASPLAGLTAAQFASEEIRLFVSVSARDNTTASEVSDVKVYGWDDIMFGMRYADAVTSDTAGTIVVDMRRVSDVVAE